MERPLRIGSRDLNAEKTLMCTFEGIALQVADGAKGSRSASGLVWVRGRRQRLWGFDERPEMRAGNLGGECKDGASWLWAPGWRG